MKKGIITKRIAIITTVLIMIILSTAVSFALTDESSPNNDYDHSAKISVGDAVTGKLDSRDAVNNDFTLYDYYTFTAPVSGKLNIEFELKSPNTIWFEVQDDKHNRLLFSELYNYGIDARKINIKSGKKYYIIAKMSISFNPEYKFTTAYLVDKPKVKAINAKKKGFKLTWKKAPKASYYQVRYTKKVTYDVYNWTKAITAKAGKKATSKTIKGLGKKKVYYVQVRAARTIAGKTYYSGWSKKKLIKTK